MIHAAQGRREVSLMSLKRHRWKKRRRRSHEYFSLPSLQGVDLKKAEKNWGIKRDVLMSKIATPAALTPAGKLTPECRKDTSPINNALAWS